MTMRITIKNEEAPETKRELTVSEIDSDRDPSQPDRVRAAVRRTSTLAPGEERSWYLHKGNYITAAES